tara:strand:- start:274 stop:915 length:642 start_codon:yes stop_codon:yes gene_type:complete
MIKLVNKYFPEITDVQTEKLIILHELFGTYNKKINLISNNSLNNFFVEHVLHSLSISKIKQFNKKEIVLDIGSGGGFPGIPLAIIFPNTHFILIDSISKKTNMIKKFKAELSLKNIKVINDRIENLNLSCDCIVSRAVTNMNKFLSLINKVNFSSKKISRYKLFYLKGGDLKSELYGINHKSVEISNFYDEKFFNEKKIICIDKKTIISYKSK